MKKTKQITVMKRKQVIGLDIYVYIYIYYKCIIHIYMINSQSIHNPPGAVFELKMDNKLSQNAYSVQNNNKKRGIYPCDFHCPGCCPLVTVVW